VTGPGEKGLSLRAKLPTRRRLILVPAAASATVSSDSGTILSRSLPVVGVAYLAFLASQPPPARWVGLACLAVVAPFAVGWALGRFAGVGPWADDSVD
jgi:hypothetical protein